MRQKNYWFMGIMGVLLCGVLMVIVSIIIALNNPIQDENTFFGEKREIDERINDIIKEQNLFHSLFAYTIWLDEGHTSRELEFVFPYLAPSHRPDMKIKAPIHIASHAGRLRFSLHHPTHYIMQAHLFLDSPIRSGALRDLGELTSKDTSTLISQELKDLPHGRWKLILEVSFAKDSHDPVKKAYLESEVFIDTKQDSAHQAALQ